MPTRKKKPSPNALAQARFRARRAARLQKLEEDAERARVIAYLEEHDDRTPIEDLQERATLLQYLDDHDYKISIEDLRERVRLLQYIEDHDYRIPIGELRERVRLLERSEQLSEVTATLQKHHHQSHQRGHQ